MELTCELLLVTSCCGTHSASSAVRSKSQIVLSILIDSFPELFGASEILNRL